MSGRSFTEVPHGTDGSAPMGHSGQSKHFGLFPTVVFQWICSGLQGKFVRSGPA